MIGKIKAALKGTNLRARILQGAFWLSAASAGEQAARLLRNMLLARMLAPQAFGLMAIVLAIDGIFESFTEIGIKEAIIQNQRSKDKSYLNGAWWLSVGRSLFVYGLVFVGAPWIADFYSTPDLVALIRFAFLSIVFRGLMSVNAYVSLKEMRFRDWVIVFHGGGFCGICVAVVLAFVIPGVWALAIGFVTESAMRCLLSYIICPFRPGLQFDKDDWRALVRYSRGMIGLPILAFIFMRADIFVIGKLCPVSDLGLYALGAALARAPSQFVNSVINQIMTPVFSQIQTDRTKINHAIMNFTRIIALIGFPLCFFATLYGRDILFLSYGWSYTAMAVPFAIVFGTEFLRITSGPIAVFYLQTGRPSLHRLFTGVRAGLMLVLIVPATHWLGLTGAALAGLVSMVIAYTFQILQVSRVNGLDMMGIVKVFLRGLLLSVAVIVVWLLSSSFLSPWPLLNLFAGILGCLASYGLVYKGFLRPNNAFAKA